MTDILIQNYGRFWMRFDLDHLHEYPAASWKKVCKQFLILPINDATTLRLRSWFPAAIQQADEAVEAAITDEERLRKSTKGLAKAEREQVKEDNKLLHRRVTDAQTKLKKLRERFEIFKEITNFLED